MSTITTERTHTRTHTCSSCSNTDGYTPPLLAALDLQWPVSLQLLMPRGACFTALPQGPNRLSISRWAAALFPINSPVQAGCRHPGAPAWREERGGGREGGIGAGKKGWGGIMPCHWTRGLFEGVGPVTYSLSTHTHTHNHKAKNASRQKSVCKFNLHIFLFLNKENQANKIKTLS